MNHNAGIITSDEEMVQGNLEDYFEKKLSKYKGIVMDLVEKFMEFHPCRYIHCGKSYIEFAG